MKLSHALMLATALILASCWTPAVSADSAAGAQRTLPVLVHVNSKGVITEITPAFRLRPGFRHIVRDTLNTMITKPALRKGKPVESQLVITLAVLTSKAVNGKAETTLKYLAAKPLPSGIWHWIRNAEGELALSSQFSNYMIEYPPTDMDTVIESGAIVNSSGN